MNSNAQRPENLQEIPAPVEQASRAGLEQAFALFNQMSTQLSTSYSMLEARVTELKGQLALVSAQRMQELAEKERLAHRLQSLLDLLPGGVIVIDGQGVVREANPVARALLGQPLVGMLWRQVIARNFAPREDDGHEISMRDGRRLSIATRSLHGEPGQLVLLTDLTETRRLQDQLSRHERLSALGRMMASLAHQIRTPLSAAMLYASHLNEQVLPVEQQQRFAGRLKERLHELEHQVRDMLVFARGELPLTDRITDAVTWLPEEWHPFLAAVHAAPDHGARKALCVTFLTPRWGAVADRHAAWLQVLQQDWQRGARQALATTLGWTPRHLQRRTRQLVGLRPGEIERMLRAEHALLTMRDGDAGALDAALRHGYADQAHFSREARSLFERPPAALKAHTQQPGDDADWLLRRS